MCERGSLRNTERRINRSTADPEMGIKIDNQAAQSVLLSAPQDAIKHL